MRHMQSVENAQVSNKRVIVRCDFDVPIENRKITDQSRLKATARTLSVLVERGGSLTLLGHIGRPKDRDPNFSLEILKNPLEKIINESINFQKELVIDKGSKINLIENLRFWSGEEENNGNFAKKLASLGELYVNECFAVCHRTHASIVKLPRLLPAFAGSNLIKEVEELTKILESPARPLVAIIGGAKLETKLPVIFNLAKIADKVLVGGKLMFEVSRSSLPENVVVAHDDINTKDIGENSQKMFSEIIKDAKMIVWNGPMGMFEDEKYEEGTKNIAKALAFSNSYTVVGGGDTIAALNKFSLVDKMDFVSTGGGAMLEFLAGKKLPGLEALK